MYKDIYTYIYTHISDTNMEVVQLKFYGIEHESFLINYQIRVVLLIIALHISNLFYRFFWSIIL